MITEVHS